jgi:hypothetical protein
MSFTGELRNGSNILVFRRHEGASSASRPASFISEDKTSSYHLIGDCMKRKVSLDVEEKRKTSIVAGIEP